MVTIRILCQVPGFRRAGVAHPADKTWPAKRFSDVELQQLREETLITLIEADEALPTTDGDGGGTDPTGSNAAAGTPAGASDRDAGGPPGASQKSADGIATAAPTGEAGQGTGGGATSPPVPAIDSKSVPTVSAQSTFTPAPTKKSPKASPKASSKK